MTSCVLANSDSSAADLRATVSLLKDLAAQAEATLNSLLAFLHPPPESSSADGAVTLSRDHDLCLDAGTRRCPYDSRHRMPPESLFRHSLRCPSSPGGPLLDLGFLETLRYSSSFKSEDRLRRECPFVRPLPDLGADLCFSLEKEMEDVGNASFFYRGCPGVVTYPEPDVSARTFTLPGVLSVECANFICSSREREIGVSARESLRILPSDFWVFKREVDAWKDYPERYSYTAARVISCLEESVACGMQKWIISNSPRFGVVIDTAMRDHICLLLKLCLKAIWREASGSLDRLSDSDGFLDPRSLCFECPRLFKSLTWLVLQLRILYGDMNGKSFAIGMIAESLLRGGSSLLLFPLDDYVSADETRGTREETIGSKLAADAGDREPKYSEGAACAIGSENFCAGQVFVSQVAAAVAALHERSLLEERVKQLRFPQLLSKFQLINKHSYVSMRANEERAKRPSYRPILENDGLLWQKPQNEGMARAKTKEELLAEERDYKRRRMSYRGKKVKRTTTQVLHDIIGKHMQEIMQAGGIGCNVKGSADPEMLISGSSFQGDATADVDVTKGKETEHSRPHVRDSFVRNKPHYREFDDTVGPVDSLRKGGSTGHYLKFTQGKRYLDHKIQENAHRGIGMGEGANYEYERSANYRSHRQSIDQYAHKRENGGKEANWSKSDKRTLFSSHSFEDHSDSSSLSSTSVIKEEYGNVSERRNLTKVRNHDSHRSESVTDIAFEDRYDPHNT